MNTLTRLCYACPYTLVRSAGEWWILPKYPLELLKYPATCFRELTVVARVEHMDVAPSHACRLAAINPDAQVVSLPMRVPWSLVLRKMVPAVRAADLVAVYIPDPIGSAAAFVSKINRVPVLAMVIGDWEEAIRYNSQYSPSRVIKEQIARRLGNSTVKCASLVMTQGRKLSRKYREICSSVRSDTVHSSLTAKSYSEQSRPLQNPATILSVGGLVALKGYDNLARAVSLLCERGCNVRWICVGGGPQIGALTKLVNELGLSAKVDFLGYVVGPELLRLYRTADVFSHPSMTEGIPNVVLEAMANSLPVVASNVGGIPDVIKNGYSGILVEPKNAHALANALEQVITDTTLAASLARNAYRIALEYDCDSLGEKMLSLISRHVGQVIPQRDVKDESSSTASMSRSLA